MSKKNCVDAIVCKYQFLAVHGLTSFRCAVQKDFSRTADVSYWPGMGEGGAEEARPAMYV